MKLGICFFFCFMVCFNAFPQSEKWQQSIDAWVKQEDFKNASIGICLMDIKSGKVMAGFDVERSLIPASTLKILSSYAAFSTAGKSYQFRTEFYLKVHMWSDSTCYADIVVIGQGDPSFGSYLLPGNKTLSEISDTVANLLKLRGIHQLVGRIIVQSTWQNDLPENPEWLWYDLGNYYGAGYFGFNVLENSASIDLNIPEEANQICEIIKVVPSCLWENYCSEAVVVETEPFESVYVMGSSPHRIYTVSGRIKKTKDKTISFYASMPNPAETYECILRDGLINRGVLFRDSLILSDIKTPELIYLHFSQSLDKLATRALHKSVNLYSESFLSLAGKYWTKNADRPTSLRQLRKFYLNKTENLDGVKIFDGSGLSPKNRMTALAMCGILQKIAIDQAGNHIHPYLPDVSQSGPLANKISKKSKLKGRYRLKSGSMEGVRAYAGYWMEGAHPKYSFCLMINNYNGGSEQIKKHIANFLIHLSQN
ncbi:MAG: D-alanyl-D-alanine carboxypeptidase/D-alanyl-D-alanine-endopeptidase [Saprospiraceae bacterium]|nr:D-alanyl-D-alanine carboxypeptidase/D-alanyl-D-alanine-endopeptidase [Saprospiraceae bacterium]